MKQKCRRSRSRAVQYVSLALILTSPLLGHADWQLVWNDEFAGTNVDATKWTFDRGNGVGGWGNNELQYYTNRPQNVYITNGLLNIVARREVPQYMGFDYTSAKLKTQNLFSKKYGRFEFRARDRKSVV